MAAMNTVMPIMMLGSSIASILTIMFNVHDPAPDGTACDSKDACTLGAGCQAGVCVAGTEKDPACLACSGNGDCAASEWCQAADGACGSDGTCVPRPDACSPLAAPVCGCDGLTYSNACSAGLAGVSVDFFGPCEEEGP